MRVIGAHVLFDLLDQIFDTFECSAADRLLGDVIEPDFNLVEPRRVRRHIMHVPARMKCQPALDGRMFVSGVIIHDHMDIKLARNVLIDAFEKVELLLMTVAVRTFRKHLAVGDVQRSKKRGGTVALVIMRHSLDIA